MCAEVLVCTDFCGRLVSGTGGLQVNAFLNLDAVLVSQLVDLSDHALAVNFGHVGEASALVVVGADQAGGSEGSDVIVDDHQVARCVAVAAAAGSVGQQQLVSAHQVHQTGGHNDVGHGVALVEVDAALHDDDLGLTDVTEHELALVAGDGGNGEAFDVVVGNGSDGLDALVSEIAQAGTQDSSDLGDEISLALLSQLCVNGCQSLLQLFFDEVHNSCFLS